MEVEILLRETLEPLARNLPPMETIKKKTRILSNDLESGQSDKELSILLTDDEEIALLNGIYRGKEELTDVLSFSQDLENTRLLGDVVISLQRAQQQADKLGVSLEEEFFRLLVHGVLHLYGYEHENVPEERAAQMFAKQDELLARIFKS